MLNYLGKIYEIFRDRIFRRSKEIYKNTSAENSQKVFYNIDLAEQTSDAKLFKKLKSDIWEFRTKYAGIQVRLLAFWDKTDNKEALVIATHGFIKKMDKIPANEIERAVRLRDNYFDRSNKRK